MLFMDTSTRSRINKLTEYIKRNVFLFKSFNNVYLFGSILNNNTIPNDIDILLIYSEYSYKIQQDFIAISSVLEKEFGLPVDLTVLSTNEERETKFLDRLNSSYLKLK